MKNYISKSKKSTPVQQIINEALDILESVGIPISNKTERRLERMAICFLAVSGVTGDWEKAKDNSNLKTRDIIIFVNKNFEENISSGSYDDIRRKDLELLVLADLIVNTGVKKGSGTNDPTRSYALHPEFKKLLITYKSHKWIKALNKFKKDRKPLSEILARNRSMDKIAIKLPSGVPLKLSLGQHNILQKKIIEDFLPIFAGGCTVLYIGDTANKSLYIETKELKRINFFDLAHDQLPDIIAFNEKNNWLFLIEAVHSSGPMSETRVLKLKTMLKECKAELIFVTAFLTKADFKKWMLEIAWETEVWTADNPDHLVHFNGHKFLGAY